MNVEGSRLTKKIPNARYTRFMCTESHRINVKDKSADTDRTEPKTRE